MSIKFAGIPLLEPPPALQKFIDDFLPFEEAHLFGVQSASLASERKGTSGEKSVLRGIGLPNYPPPPRLKLNTLYWPTGASRWARGVFVTTGENVDKIVEKLEALRSVGGAESLVITDDDDKEKRTITAKMRLLPPQPITTSSKPETEETTLWLLPLVDARFFWQWRPTGDLTVNNATTWTGLISTLASALGVTIDDDDIDSDYQQPDHEECHRDQENAATLLDAVLHSIGHRLIAKLDGTYKTENFDTAEDTWGDNFNTAHEPWEFIGGELRNKYERTAHPEKVRCVFPKYIEEFRTLASGQVYTKEVALSAVTLTPAPDHTGVVDTVKLIYSTCMANYLYSGASLASTPDNQTAVDNLATQIATDYYKSLSRQYAYSFASISRWTPCAFDDAMEFSVGWIYPPDGPIKTVQTRVWSRAVNFDAEEMIHQVDFSIDSPFPRAPATLRVSTDEALARAGQATCSVLDHTGADPNGNAHEVEVFERVLKSGSSDIATGKILIVAPHATDSLDLIWVAIAAECA